MNRKSDWKHTFIQHHRVARLATVGANGQPHVVPIVYAYDGERLYTPIDEKPKKVGATQLRRVRDIQDNPAVAAVIDDYREEWEQLAWVQVRGTARILTEGEQYAAGLGLLMAKYSQYQDMPLSGRPLIAMAIEEVVGWRARGE